MMGTDYQSFDGYSPLYMKIIQCLVLGSAVTLMASGCVYRINIQQGNFLNQSSVDTVKEGMTRSQVRYLLGTPMVADSFNKERWDYIYYLKKGRTLHVDSRRVTVYFDGDKVEIYGHAPRIDVACAALLEIVDIVPTFLVEAVGHHG
ncbi:MAG TPA: outer membrane protein assembly factor BamE, partial [Steroidobacteraceae bacterium]|nr:outer membrane protein assembly factor BamE [Steroidobacteraceae bacterium]